MSTDNDDERYTVSSVRCLPRAYRYHHQRSGPIRPVTGCCFCELFVSFCLPLSLSLFLLGRSSHPSVSPYLSDCTQAARLPPLGERHSVKVPYQKPAAAARYHAHHFAPSCHGRLGPWTMLYLVRIDGRG